MDDSTKRSRYDKLPKYVIPTHYDLYLKPDLQNFTFDGTVNVSLKVNAATDEIKFHSAALKLSDVALQSENGTSLSVELLLMGQFDSESETLKVPNGLQPGSYKLFIRFKGTLNDDLRGFYKAKYVSPEGEERFCAITQFEASKAHRCFPCWDEPAFKATFDITVCCAKDRMALSNMPILDEKDDNDGSKIVRFYTSPIMSTYLVAVVVGEFDYLEQSTENGIKVRVYTPLKKHEQGQFALDAAVKILPYFENFFKIAYPLPKLDLIAVPSLSFGAMENWGLITYRETCLLVDPTMSSTKKMQYISIIVAHEIAHQWFGNLVTMEWWDHLWLNEGYATFMEFLCVANLFPEYKIWNHFITLIYSPAMTLDALETSHPVQVPVNHPLDVDEIFDVISYNKGASLIRMIYGFIGDDNFEKGMNMYLNKFQYRNASTDDLWQVLEDASKKPISSIMPDWTKRAGYPVIAVQRVQEEDKCKLSLKQFKFCSSGDNAGSDCEKWIVPVEYCTANSNQQICKFELDSQEGIIVIDELGEKDWVKLNPGNFGFYRVQYSPDMLANLIPAIADLSLPPVDRLNLLDDLFALVQAGYSKSDKILELLLSMSNEDSYMVWSSMSNVIMKLKKILEYTDSSLQSSFVAFGHHLLEQIKERITWDSKPDDTHEDKLLRILILDLLGEFEDKAIVAEAEKRLKSHLDGSVPLPPDLRATVYTIGMKNAKYDFYQTILKLYHAATLQEEKERILYALAAMKDEALIRHFIMFVLSENVRKESALSVLRAMARTRQGREQVWDYWKSHWSDIAENFAGTFTLPHLVSGVFSCAASNEMAKELQSECKSKTVLGIERSVCQALENIRVNVGWLERDISVFRSFLLSIE